MKFYLAVHHSTCNFNKTQVLCLILNFILVTYNLKWIKNKWLYLNDNCESTQFQLTSWMIHAISFHDYKGFNAVVLKDMHCFYLTKSLSSIQFWSGFIPVNGVGQIYPTLTAITQTLTLHLETLKIIMENHTSSQLN